MKIKAFKRCSTGAILTEVEWHGKSLTPVVREQGGRLHIILRHQNVTSRFWFTAAQQAAYVKFVDSKRYSVTFEGGLE